MEKNKLNKKTIIKLLILFAWICFCFYAFVFNANAQALTSNDLNIPDLVNKSANRCGTFAIFKNDNSDTAYWALCFQTGSQSYHIPVATLDSNEIKGDYRLNIKSNVFGIKNIKSWITDEEMFTNVTGAFEYVPSNNTWYRICLNGVTNNNCNTEYNVSRDNWLAYYFQVQYNYQIPLAPSSDIYGALYKTNWNSDFYVPLTDYNFETNSSKYFYSPDYSDLSYINTPTSYDITTQHLTNNSTWGQYNYNIYIPQEYVIDNSYLSGSIRFHYDNINYNNNQEADAILTFPSDGNFKAFIKTKTDTFACQTLKVKENRSIGYQWYILCESFVPNEYAEIVIVGAPYLNALVGPTNYLNDNSITDSGILTYGISALHMRDTTTPATPVEINYDKIISDSVNDINNSINNPNVDPININEIYSKISTPGPITTLLGFPIVIANSFLNNIGTCSPYVLGDFFGETITFPCVTISDWIGSSATFTLDLFISGFLILKIRKQIIKIWNNFTSLKDGDVLDD